MPRGIELGRVEFVLRHYVNRGPDSAMCYCRHMAADMPGTWCGAPDLRRPVRAGISTELLGTNRCRPEFCGDAARAARGGASRAIAPRRLSGHATGGVPRGTLRC